MNLTKVALVASLMGLSQAGWFGGGCPNAQPQQNFDLDRYLGRWYETYRSKSISFEDGECVTAEYSKRDDGQVRVFNSMQEWINGEGGPFKS